MSSTVHVPEWRLTIHSVGVHRTGVNVPLAAIQKYPDACAWTTYDGWMCTRKVRHRGRHAAALSWSGEVIAVWR